MKKKGWVGEFVEFIEGKDVVNLAVGVIIGAAVGQIVNSLVNNIIMPLVGVLLGGNNIAALSFTVGKATVTYGVFLQSVLNFLIIALCVFWMIKLLNKLQRRMHLGGEAKHA